MDGLLTTRGSKQAHNVRLRARFLSFAHLVFYLLKSPAETIFPRRAFVWSLNTNKFMRSNPARAWDAANGGPHKPSLFQRQFNDAAQVLSKRRAKTDHVTLSKRRAWKYKVQDPISPAPKVSSITWA